MTTDQMRDDPGSSWRDDAACLDHPAEWFTGPHEPGDTQRAIDVCTTCPVKQPCLETALSIEVSSDLGIRGGTTPATRRRMRRKRGNRDDGVTAGHSGRDLETRKLAGATGPAHDATVAIESKRGLPLYRDPHGDFIDSTGRVIVFEIHGQPPVMLMINGRPRARARTVEDAAALAAALLAKDASTHAVCIASDNHNLTIGRSRRT
jgi:hypothetical protein